MKILITTDLYTTATNGVVTSVRNLTGELRRAGHEVRILTLSENRKSRQEEQVSYIRSLSLERVYPDIRMPTSYRHRLIRELIAWKPDVIHSQCEMFSYQFALYISRRTGAPIVHTYHTLYEQYIPYVLPFQRLGERMVRAGSRMRLKKAKRVIAPTSKVENVLQSYGLPNPISVIPSGIDLAQHRQRLCAGERQQLRSQLGIEPDELVLLNLGRLGTEKNIDELLRFFAVARKEFPKLKFLIVGGGPAREGLEQLTQELELGGSVIFTGMVEPSQVQKYYQLGDVFVSASTSETQGLTYIEATANGLPLLCRQDPCLVDVLLPGENGIMYTCEEDFLTAVESIFADPEWRAAAGSRSRQIADRFDKAVFGSAVEEVYTSVLR